SGTSPAEPYRMQPPAPDCGSRDDLRVRAAGAKSTSAAAISRKPSSSWAIPRHSRSDCVAFTSLHGHPRPRFVNPAHSRRLSSGAFLAITLAPQLLHPRMSVRMRFRALGLCLGLLFGAGTASAATVTVA